MALAAVARLKLAELTKAKCEASLLYFTRYTFKKQFGQDFVVNWHHRLICKELQDLVDGKSMATGGGEGRTEVLILNMPPRYTKTELAVVRFTAWCLARNPRAKFIHTSFSDDLVQTNSQQIKDIINHECFKDLWDVQISNKTDSKGEWYTTDGGGMYAVPAKGTITGFGAGSTIEGAYGHNFGGAIEIDDPLKPIDASSDVMRGEVNKRLNNTIISRRNSREVPIIITMQRLHEDDMTGYILAEKSGLRYRHVKIPALSEKGEALWPMKHTAEELLKMQSADPYNFSGQMQQEPSPLSGELFKLEDVQYYDKIPENCHFYGASDHATGEDKGDFTEHGMVAVDEKLNIYVADWWYGQRNTKLSTEVMLAFARQYSPMMWGVEAGPIWRAVEPFVMKMMQENNVYFQTVAMPSVGSKSTRSQAIQGRFAQRKVFFPRGTTWAGRLINQLMKFPNGKQDDGVDVMSLIGRMVMDLRGKAVEKKKEEPVFQHGFVLDPLEADGD